MKEENVLRIPAKLEGMDVILAFVSFLLDAHGCAPKLRSKIRMAVEELYVNVSLYAYPAADGWVEIRGSVEDGVATFQLIDGRKALQSSGKAGSRHPAFRRRTEHRRPGDFHGEKHGRRAGIRLSGRLQPTDAAEAALS